LKKDKNVPTRSPIKIGFKKNNFIFLPNLIKIQRFKRIENGFFFEILAHILSIGNVYY